MNIKNREGFLELAKCRNYKTGLEVGVRHGDYSRFLVKNYKWKEFYGIDCDSRCSNHTQDLIQHNYKMVIGKSPDISTEFEDNYFDFIYIDAWHTYESVTKDLIAWWPKLKDGGLFCGDDYMLAHDHPESKFEVVEAVEDFFNTKKISYCVTGYNCLDSDSKIEYAKKTWNLFKNQKKQDNISVPQWWTIKCFQ